MIHLIFAPLVPMCALLVLMLALRLICWLPEAMAFWLTAAIVFVMLHRHRRSEQRLDRLAEARPASWLLETNACEQRALNRLTREALELTEVITAYPHASVAALDLFRCLTR